MVDENTTRKCGTQQNSSENNSNKLSGVRAVKILQYSHKGSESGIFALACPEVLHVL